MTQEMTYQGAGVDIEAGDALVEKIKPLARMTKRPEVLDAVGGFASLFELPTDRYEQPVLVSATDGVGTKLRLALMTNRFDTIGQDLVAMCVNDLVVTGAEPLFFLDYFACGQLEVDKTAKVIEGIAKACKLSGCSLVGGETAEMPGFYATGDFDLAGFAVGVVEKSRIVRAENVRPNDVLIALPSSGVHSNGFSLIRRIMDTKGITLEHELDGKNLADILLEPTKIYTDEVLALHNAHHLVAAAHITGGGLIENIPRVLPNGTKAVINTKSWTIPPIFTYLQEQGNVSWPEMLRTFNCGVGMVVCVPDHAVDEALSVLKHTQPDAWCIGYIAEHEGKPEVELL